MSTTLMTTGLTTCFILPAMHPHHHRSNDMKRLSRPSRHTFLWTVLKVLLVPSTIYMLWKALSVVAGSAYPVVVVISESMEPAFRRGDLLLVSNRKHNIEVGDIPVCWFAGNPLPMVHRATSVTYAESNSYSGNSVYVTCTET